MILSTNIIVEYEKAEKKTEGSINAQLKWHLGKNFEPTIEVYADEYSKLIGPMVMGKLKAG